MKVLSLFSGIGAFEKALDRLDVSYELVGFSEIDKYAIDSYCAIHNVDKSMNLGDITKIDTQALPKDIDLITYGFPCQDISLAGKQKGLFNEDGSQTRSGLFFEALRIIEDTQPKVAIAENVKNLTGKTFKPQFEIVLKSLEEAGYNNYWKVLNAKDYGVPQNRERVFIVSIRKDIDTGRFAFPEGLPLSIRLKDVLDSEVDEKYYLKNTKDFFIKNSFDMEQKGNGFRFDPHVRKNADIAKTITTRAGGRMDDNFVLDIDSESSTFKFDSSNEDLIKMIGLLDIKGNEQVRRVYDVDGLSPTLNTMQGGNREPKIMVKEATKKGYAEASEGDSINLEQPNSQTRRGRDGHGVAQTLTTSPQQAVVEPLAAEELRIRKLTPRECFRLMDFGDEDFDKCLGMGMSNAQLYKQAGNSIVVAVPYYIIKSLIEAGIFEYKPTYDIKPCPKDGNYAVQMDIYESLLLQEEEKVSESSDKPIEYTFNPNKLIELLLRENVISVKE